MFLLLASLAAAGIPDGLLPAPAPVDTPQQYAEYLQSTGKSADPLACDVLWKNEALLCFKLQKGDKVRWVTERDVTRWGTDLAGLRAEVERQAIDVLERQPVQAPVPDMDGRVYWVAAEGNGWAAAPLLLPSTAALRMGQPTFLAAIPVEGVSMFWRPGDAELDKVMAVGVAEMHDNEDGPVTATVMRWDGQKWLPYAQAEKKRKDPGLPL